MKHYAPVMVYCQNICLIFDLDL